MPQFSVYRNLNPATRTAVPFLLDVQSDLISDLGTRVVVPLYTVSTMKGKLLKTLTPVLRVDGRQCVMVTPQLAGISRRELGPLVSSLSAQRSEIMAALDMLITGI
jgi:toxin CcdB